MAIGCSNALALRLSCNKFYISEIDLGKVCLISNLGLIHRRRQLAAHRHQLLDVLLFLGTQPLEAEERGFIIIAASTSIGIVSRGIATA